MKIHACDILKYESAEYSENLNAFVPSQVVVSLVQDNGKAAVATVKPGDVVEEGQVVAASTSLNSSVIHSPVPGIVDCFISRSMPDGRKSSGIKIKMRGEFSLFGKPKADVSWTAFPATSLKRLLVDSGIVNTFEAAFPIGSQITSALQKKKSPVVVLRMFDKDPSCFTDRFIAKKYHGQVIEGAKIVAAAAESKSIVVFYPKNFDHGHDERKDDTILSFANVDDSLYPCGGKRELIKFSCAKNSEVEKLCDDDIFLDSSTAFSVYEAVVKSQPVVDKIIQVSGNALAGAGMIKTRIGVSMRSLAAEYGGFVKAPEKIIINGLLHGTNISDLDTPVTKYVKSIFFLSKKDLADQTVSDCIHCGKCRSVCPSGLVPDMLYAFYKLHRDPDFEYLNMARKCSGCVLCNSVCPSRLPLSQTISILKGLQDEK